MRADRQGLGSLYVAQRMAAPSNTVVIFGDSITNQNGEVSALGITDRGYWNWANIKLGSRFELLDNAGIGGDRTDQMLARIQTDVLPFRPGWCVLMGGANNISNGFTAAAAFADIKRMCAILLGAGIRVVLCTVSTSTFYDTAAKAVEYFKLNTLLREYARRTPNIVLADTGSAFIDPTTALPSPIANSTVDAVHPSAYGAGLMADQLYLALKDQAPAVPFLTSSKNDSGNMQTNGVLLGTTGGLGTTTTGTVAEGWTVGTFNGTAAAACSKVARTDGLPGEWQQIVLSGGDGLAHVSIFPTDWASTGFAVGDTVYGLWEFESDADWTGVKLLECWLEVRDAGPTALATSFAIQHENDGVYPNLIWNPRKGILRTPPLVVPTGATRVRMNARFKATSGTIRWGRSEVRKVLVL